MDAHVGTFETTTGTSDIVVTGAGFQPKVVIFFWGGSSSATDAIAAGTIQRGVGWATSSTNRACVNNLLTDNVGTSDASRRKTTTAVCDEISNTGAITGSLDFSTMDSDGFTLVVDNAFTTSIRVSYLALGGSDVVNAYAGYLNEGTGSATETVITDPGFQPNVLLIADTFSGAGSAPRTGTDARLNFGADDATNAFCISHRSEDGFSPTDEFVYTDAVRSYCGTGSNTNAQNAPASVSSFDASGFTWDWAYALNNDQSLIYLALELTNVAVGTLNTKTDGTDIAVSGLGFKPAAVLFASACYAANSTQDVREQKDAFTSFGAATSETSRVCQATFSEDAVTTTNVSHAIDYDSVYVRQTNAAAADAVMDVKSVDSGGFTCVMDNTESSARLVGYIAFGPAAAAGGAFPYHSVKQQRKDMKTLLTM